VRPTGTDYQQDTEENSPPDVVDSQGVKNNEDFP
jgi:hypothetical protein